MKTRYTIAYKGLPAGEHLFDFQTDNAFWDGREASGIKAGKVDARVKLVKSATGNMRLETELNGAVTVPCDRCLEDCDLTVRHKGAVDVKFSEDEGAGQGRTGNVDSLNEMEDGDILWVNPRENVLDLEQYIYETIVLALPLRRVHPEDVHGRPLCNPAMLERFKIVTEQEWAEKFEGGASI
jgi:uncharacterized metal-binding protein YceD (DUF177 family)